MASWCVVWLLSIAAPQEGPEVGRPAAESRVSQPASPQTSKTSEVSETSEVSAKVSQKPRSGRELSDAVQAALRRWARPSDARADQAAREFLTLFDELGKDRDLGPVSREALQVKVRARLAQLADQISKRIPREKRVPTLAAPPGQENLAQLGGFGGQGGAGIGEASAMGTAARGGWTPDDAELLVDLIHRTIAPTTWDVNGGHGTIQYWRPGRALVIRQTTEVHDDIADFLRQLERAGR